ncbi:MAG: tetraacyldisaccharide 4'-kinase [Gammaproteobacteria bacterium]|nr:tetraacyldisaccharide 4'-kinase [Gammaproteobacteria bacterium]
MGHTSNSFLGRVSALQHLWATRNALAISLLPLAWTFRTLADLRRQQYLRRRHTLPRPPVPVVVVGNITVGGTGKTPLVIWLAELLKANGYRPGIISRGYGGRANHWPQIVTALSDPHQVGDEPVLIASRSHCPTAVAPCRFDAARALLAEYDCDVLIADDGLQHYRLVRDMEIAVIDGDKGLGNRWCLPAGPLREPPSRLREVDLVIVNGRRGDTAHDDSRMRPGARASARYRMALEAGQMVNLADARVRQPLEAMRGRQAHAVAAIGNPARFFDSLKAGGLVLRTHVFRDHHPFTSRDLDFGDAQPVVMTEKDAVKCREFAQTHHWYLPVAAVPDTYFARAVLARLRALAPASLKQSSEPLETNRYG